jgi:VWFA-related protein
MARISSAVALLALMLTAMAVPAAQTPQLPKIRVSTRLVRVNVVVRDKNGPVTNLTQDDFVVLDRGKRRSIAVFSAESGASGVESVRPLPQNTFSDLPQYGADKPRSVTIVLLDNINTLYGSAPEPYETRPSWVEDLALTNAKAHLVKYIQELDPHDRVAIYGLRESLYVLCDFTSNRSELLAILKKYDTRSLTNRETAEPGAIHTPVPGSFNAQVDSTNMEMAAMRNGNRASITMAALRSIAAHAASIPGPKNLVWLTTDLPFSPTAMARVLTPAQIAVYPIDGRGLLARQPIESLEGVEDEDAAARGFSMPAQASQPIGISTMQELADETGGQAGVNTNDLTGVIRRAVENSMGTYTLGFYIDHDSIDGKFHRLRIEVKPKGLSVRYPSGYFAFDDTAPKMDESRANLMMALRSPIESSAIPVQVRIARGDKPLPHSLNIFGSIDIRNLQLAQDGPSRKGAVEIMTIEQDPSGKVLAQSGSTINLQLDERQYAAFAKSGFPFHQVVQPEPQATTLRILVEDPRTAEVGGLIIPLSEVR